MAVIFSNVTAESRSISTGFIVSGIPHHPEELRRSCDYEDFISELDDGEKADIHVESYVYGDGAEMTASPEELAYIIMKNDDDPMFLYDQCVLTDEYDFTVKK